MEESFATMMVTRVSREMAGYRHLFYSSRDLISLYQPAFIEDGYDETLVPLDYETAGQIRDDDLFLTLIGKMPRDVQLTCVMDCCHSGSVLDLPYTFIADGEHEEMTASEEFDFGPLLSLAQQLLTDSATGGSGQQDPVAQVMALCGCSLM